MNWEKLPGLKHCFQTCGRPLDQVFIARRTFAQLEARYLRMEDLNEQLERQFLRDWHGPFLLEESMAGFDYRMELRAIKNPEFQKLLKIDVDLED
jgi:hypothetical protein